ncbi:thermonuclease family protein [Heyndrickxia coagulans]|nr:thermonuclease family protein [Heyndrickxia coagulans]MED4492932.1 thermonuclease family protein [Heyndrickxia coagulans]MED4535601.1 thermonuclease family protein [Heyndrickxia coagulans]UYM83483.1 thermonuclease family protein [Heyndrickxia coagulans]UYM83486.1 thermonuclease family protein [Heyndrickxia coagulans]
MKKEESKKSNISAKKADDGKKEEKNKQADENKRADEQKKDKASVAAGTTAAVSTKNKQSKSNNTNKQKTSATPTNQEPVTLVETVDGDTIKVNYKGKTETVRYLLVDTPEEKKPGTCVQPYAVSAYNKNKQLVNSGKLTLEFETNGDKYDKYGRLLAYVFVNGKSVQEELLKGGYARVAYIYNPPYKYLSKYESDENTAKSNHLNIWSESGYVTDSGFNGCAKTSSGTSTASSDSSTTSHSTNSGSSNGSSSSATSAPTSSGGTEIFANCTELRKKYPNGVPKGHPAYQEKMDRDHDNYACER